MELKVVKTADAYPSEGNPREDFGDLDALAASLALNPANPGEPLNPPVLVADGDVYRIVDGERRWRAMGIAGTKEFHAVVCEDWEDADAALAMLATDDKKALTEVERSRGVQRCLLLGVEPEKVEKAARRKGMRRVKRAADRLGAEAELMSIDHLIAVDELAEWPELAQKVADADEKAWQRAYEAAKAEVKRAEDEAALRKAAERLRLDLEEDGADTAGMAYALTCRAPEDLEAAAEEYAGGALYVMRSDQYNGARIVAYTALPDEEGADPELQAARERAEAWLRRMADAHASATQYAAEALAGGATACPAVMAMAAEDYLGDAGQQWSERAKAAEFMGRFELGAPATLGTAPNGLLGIALLRRLADGCAPSAGDMTAAAGAGAEPMREYGARRVLKLCDYLAAAMEDGWKPAPEDVDLACKLAGIADAALAEDEEE